MSFKKIETVAQDNQKACPILPDMDSKYRTVFVSYILMEVYLGEETSVKLNIM